MEARSIARIVAVIVTALSVTTEAGAQTRLHVNAGAPAGGDGSTWAQAFVDLQDALAAARPGDEIWVAAGTYKPDTPPGVRTSTFRLVSRTRLYGGFAGTESLLEQRNVATNITTLSGDLDGNDVVGEFPDGNSYLDNCYHVVTASAAGATTRLDGFTVTAGRADYYAGPSFLGGGMFIELGSTLTIANCTFRRNYGHEGGGVYCRQSDAVLESCLFIDNASLTGGGMKTGWNSNPVLTDCRFLGNRATDGGGFAHGFNANSASDVVLTNCTFIGNAASRYGGALHDNHIGTMTLINCTVAGNTAPTEGGAIVARDSTVPALRNCVVWQNGPDAIVSLAAVALDIEYSNVAGPVHPGAGNISADPLFVEIEGPDGIPGTTDDNARLQAGSPGIDAADCTAVPPGVTSDLDGRSRFIDDPDTPDTGIPGIGGEPVIDMGAYEFPAVTCPADVNGDNAIDFNDLLAVLSAWGPCPGCAEDIDTSGDVGFSDLLAVLAGWGACP